MSANSLSSWGKWQQTRNALATSLALNIAARNAASVGSPEETQLQANVAQSIKDLKAHALNGLKAVDLAIADQNLVSNISLVSEAAKKEADRIKKVVAKVNELTSLVGKLTNLVSNFELL